MSRHKKTKARHSQDTTVSKVKRTKEEKEKSKNISNHKMSVGSQKRTKNDFLDPSEKKIIDCSVLADAILVHNLLDNIATLFFY